MPSLEPLLTRAALAAPFFGGCFSTTGRPIAGADGAGVGASVGASVGRGGDDDVPLALALTAAAPVDAGYGDAEYTAAGAVVQLAARAFSKSFWEQQRQDPPDKYLKSI